MNQKNYKTKAKTLKQLKSLKQKPDIMTTFYTFVYLHYYY